MRESRLILQGKCLTIGPPKETAYYTSKELAMRGVVGIYEDESIPCMEEETYVCP